jgi:hypothetical protein
MLALVRAGFARRWLGFRAALRLGQVAYHEVLPVRHEVAILDEHGDVLAQQPPVSGRRPAELGDGLPGLPGADVDAPGLVGELQQFAGQCARVEGQEGK